MLLGMLSLKIHFFGNFYSLGDASIDRSVGCRNPQRRAKRTAWKAESSLYISFVPESRGFLLLLP